MTPDESPSVPPQEESTEQHGVGRRAMLQSLAGGLGMSAALPFTQGHPVQHHLQNPAKVATADKKAAKAAYKPEFLDTHQFQTLEVLAERIVPRSTEARVAPFIDQLLTVDSPSNRRSAISSLGAFDMFANERFGKPWKSLTAGQQDQLLTEASTMEPGRQPSAMWDPRQPSQPTGRMTMRDHFENVKGWVSGAYYSSEIGMRELGWTGQMFFDKLPGCDHPGGHA